MNVIQKAIDDVKFIIPPPILAAVFNPKHRAWRAQSVSIDTQIRNLVIRPRVFVDCNLAGGKEIKVPLNGLTPDFVNQFTTVYRIPKERTQGRSIMSVLNVTYTDPNMQAGFGGSFGDCGVSAVGSMTTALMNASAPIPNVSTSSISIIGENVIEVLDSQRLPAYGYLRCIIAHDENMSHLPPRSYRSFCKLVEYAVKAYIFNNYVVEMDMAELSGGVALGRFKEIVDGYQDANELYETYRIEKWDKIAKMVDRDSFDRQIKSIFGGPR